MYLNDIKLALDILGLDIDSNMKDAKKNYRSLVLKYHPDQFEMPSSEIMEKMQEINFAYDTLIRLDLLADQKFSTIINDDISDFQNTINWSGTPTNENSFMERGEYSRFNKPYFKGHRYFWDPEFEGSFAFCTTIENGIHYYYENMINSVIPESDGKEFTLSSSNTFSHIFLDSFRDRVFYLVQQEYVRPYYCVGKIISVKGKDPLSKNGNELLPIKRKNKLGREVSKTKGREVIGRRPFEFDDVVVDIDLECTKGERTEAIEELSVGEELEAKVYPNHPVYPSQVILVNAEGKEVGRLPIYYCISLGPMILSKQATVSAKVIQILRRNEQKSYSVTAKIRVEMFIHINHPILDVVRDNRKEIQKYVSGAKKLLSIQKQIIDDKEKRGFITNFIEGECESIFDTLHYCHNLRYTLEEKDKSVSPGFVHSTSLLFYELPTSVLMDLSSLLYDLSGFDFVIKYYEERTKQIYYVDKNNMFSYVVRFRRYKDVNGNKSLEARVSLYENRLLL